MSESGLGLARLRLVALAVACVGERFLLLNGCVDLVYPVALSETKGCYLRERGRETALAFAKQTQIDLPATQFSQRPVH